MQPPQPLPHLAGPTSLPHAFRRVTGAHRLITSLLLADLIGLFIWIVIGALIGPPLWWGVHALLHVFHASLLLDLWLILVVCCLWIGLYRLRSMRRTSEDAWGCVSLIIVLSGAAMAVIWLLHSTWMLIPAGVIPAVPLVTSFQFVLTPQGAEVLAGLSLSLSLLAHLYVVWRARTDPAAQPLSLSRAHPGGPIWQRIEQAYALYRQGLARFNPPPISHLKTPPTFSYYQRQTSLDTNQPSNPEQELYWHGGHLVLNRASIGPKDEQAAILLPQLSRLLYDCNTLDRTVAQLFHLAHVAERSWLTALLLVVPLIVSQEGERRWETMERERVLDRDWFAFACGQGPGLRKWLRLQLQDRTDNGLLDTAIPTLAEKNSKSSGCAICCRLHYQTCRRNIGRQIDKVTEGHLVI